MIHVLLLFSARQRAGSGLIPRQTHHFFPGLRKELERWVTHIASGSDCRAPCFAHAERANPVACTESRPCRLLTKINTQNPGETKAGCKAIAQGTRGCASVTIAGAASQRAGPRAKLQDPRSPFTARSSPRLGSGDTQRRPGGNAGPSPPQLLPAAGGVARGAAPRPRLREAPIAGGDRARAAGGARVARPPIALRWGRSPKGGKRKCGGK